MSGRLMVQMMSGGAFAALLAGCAATGPEPEQLRATPVQSASMQASKVDAIYSSAVSAIERRDYARALDLLQVARREDAGDVRVLNALGVVYDKLGRFDLSRRYYAEAARADPASPVVRANIAYSERLQAQASGRALLAEAPIIQVAPPAEAPAARAAAPEAPIRVVAEAEQPKALDRGPERMRPPSVADVAVRVLAALDISPSEPAAPASQPEQRLRAAADPAAIGVVERVSLTSPTGVDRPFAKVAEIAPAAEPLHLQPPAEPRRLGTAPEAAPAVRRVRLTTPPGPRRVQPLEPPERERSPQDRDGLIHRVLAGLGLRDREEARPPAAGAVQPATFDLAGLRTEPLQRLEAPAPAWPWLTPRMRTLQPATIELAEDDTPAPPVALARFAFETDPALHAAPPLRLATPTSEPRVSTPAWPGVRIVDATGRFARGEPLRASLADLGWTAPRSAMQSGPRQTETVIYYPANRAAVAKALARTLPGFARLEGCDAPCGGLQLVIGEDARAWGPMPRPSQRGAKGRTV